MIRLNKYLSDSGCCSRRKADEHILAGDVELNGRIVRELGIKIDPDKDSVKFNGQLVEGEQKLVYYALNKPKSVVSTASDEHGRKTVVDLVPEKPRVYPIGRLDENSEGLILLTNDGDFAQKLSHPSFEHEKEYELKVKKQGSKIQADGDIEFIRKSFLNGLRIDDKLMKATKADIKLLNSKHYLLNIVLVTGHNRQLRRMCAKIGLEVLTLARVRIGKLALHSLKIEPGQYREISPSMVL